MNRALLLTSALLSQTIHTSLCLSTVSESFKTSGYAKGNSRQLIHWDADTSSTSSSTVSESVKTGGCVKGIFPRELIHRAADPSECDYYDVDSEITYLPADEMIHDCSTDNLPIGSCDKDQCAINKDSCIDPQNYEPPHAFGQCNVEGMFVKDIYTPTKYGGCMDNETGEITCLLSSADCYVSELWIPALDRCRCHDVKIGTCEGTEYRPATCAMSSVDCNYSPFLSAREDVDWACRLCPNEDSTAFKKVRDGVSSDDTIRKSEKTKESFDAGEIVGVVLGVLMTILFVVVGLFIAYSHNSVDEYLHENPYAKEGDFERREMPDIPVGIV